MRQLVLLGVGMSWLCAVAGCSSEPAPQSKVDQSAAGGGSGGMAGSLSLGDDAGTSGSGGTSGGGGAAGAGGETTQAGSTLGGSGAGGSTSQGSAGTSSSAGNSGSGGSAPRGSCMRAPGFDPECSDLFPDLPEAHACSSLSAASVVNQMHDGVCASISLVEAGAFNICCPP